MKSLHTKKTCSEKEASMADVPVTYVPAVDTKAPTSIALVSFPTHARAQTKDAYRTGAIVDLTDRRQRDQELVGTVARPTGSPMTARNTGQ